MRARSAAAVMLASLMAGLSCDSPTGPGSGGSDVGSVQITTPASTTLHVGGTVTLSAVVLNTSGSIISGRVVTWSSADSTVATVNLNTGVVQGVRPGEVTVSASSEGKHGALRLTVLGAPASVEVSPPSASLVKGGTQNFTTLVKDVNGNVLANPVVSWSTSDAAVFTVDQNGRVTGINTGSAQVIATSGGKQGTAQVNVAQAPVATVTLSPGEASTSVGQPVQFAVELKDAAGNVLTGRPVVWSSSDAAILAVTPAGLATGVAVGSATVRAASEGRTGTALVTVTAVPVVAVEVSPPAAEMQVGGSAQLTATLRSATGEVLTGRPLTWHSSAPAIAAVSTSGLVTGVASGTAQITATAEGKTGTARIDVTNAPVATVQVTPATAQVNTGNSVSFDAVLRDAANRVLAGRAVSWTSSNPSVATVNSSGHATGISAGQTTITAASEGKSGTARLNVVVPAVATVAVMPDSMTLAAADTVKLIAVARDAAGTILTGRPVSWASSAPGVATITPQGVARGVAAGRAAAIANVEGKTGNAVIIVENPVPTLTSLSPDTATEGRAGLTLTVRGSRFVPGSRVRWNGSDRPTTYVNAGELRAVISQEDLSSPGTPQVSVFNSPPGGGISGVRTFEIKASGSITLGSIVSGLLSVPGEVDTYTFSGTVGLEVVVFFQGTSGSSSDELLLTLYGPTGSQIEQVYSDGRDATLEGQNTGRLRLSSNGTYTVRVRGYNSTDDRGGYRLRVFPVKRAPEQRGAGVTIGAIVEGEEISPVGDVDEFTFTGAFGAELNVFFQGVSGNSSDDFVLTLFAPNGSQLGPQVHTNGRDLTLEGQSSGRISLPANGTYTARVTGYDSRYDEGPFRFQLFPINRGPERTAAPIVPGTPVTGEDISPVGDVDEFTFAASAGATLRITLQVVSGNSSDNHVAELIAPSGARVGSLLHASGGYPIQFSAPVVVTESGTYRVRVYGYDDQRDTGHYVVQVIRS